MREYLTQKPHWSMIQMTCNDAVNAARIGDFFQCLEVDVGACKPHSWYVQTAASMFFLSKIHDQGSTSRQAMMSSTAEPSLKQKESLVHAKERLWQPPNEHGSLSLDQDTQR